MPLMRKPDISASLFSHVVIISDYFGRVNQLWMSGPFGVARDGLAAVGTVALVLPLVGCSPGSGSEIEAQ